MSKTRQSALLGAILVLLLVLAAAGWHALQPPAMHPGEPSVLPRAELAAELPAAEPEPEAAPDAERVLRGGDTLAPAAGGDLETSVVWPLEIDLTLLASATYERPADLHPIGSGATAELRGTIRDANGAGLAARVSFLAGTNAGRVLTCDSTGSFGASDLYPGLAVVRVEAPTGLVAEREVRLRQKQHQLLNLSFGMPAAVYGQVLDSEGAPLAGVEVTFDGQRSLTDEAGEFHFPRVAGGTVLATFAKDGYASYRETVPITMGRTVPKDRLKFHLEAGATLELKVQGSVGSSTEPAQVFLLPHGNQRVNDRGGQRTYPWHRVSPIELWPGESRRITGLPAGHVRIAAFRPGAIANPRTKVVRLWAGREAQEVVVLEPGPELRGKVTRSGKPVAGAQVTLEAPNRQSASERVLGADPTFWETMVVPHVPGGLQRGRSDAAGRFVFTIYPDVATGYYLSAQTEDGLWRGSAIARPVAELAEIALERASQSEGRLSLGLSSRIQPLPVRLRVLGAPREPFDLPPEEERLVVEGLELGTWRLDASWHREEILSNVLVHVDGGSGEPSLHLDLPQGAIRGQSLEERQRAGH